ncbi:hypothetical protein ACFW08_05695 [Streptomyces sp. NPDC058960]
MIREADMRVVRAWPDEEPVEFNLARCVYASWPWLTDEFMRELEEES